MEIMLNAERRQVSEQITAAQLLEQLSINPERVVVEVNLTVLKRDQLSTTILKEGDQVEIVHFVGGGSSDKRHQTGDQRLESGRSHVSRLMSWVS